MKLEKFLSELSPCSLNEIVAGVIRDPGGSGDGGEKSQSTSSKKNKNTGKTSKTNKTKKIHVCGCP